MPEPEICALASWAAVEAFSAGCAPCIVSIRYVSGPRERLTERLVSAMENPHVDCIGHLTGRLLGKRDGYAVNLDKIFITGITHTGTPGQAGTYDAQTGTLIRPEGLTPGLRYERELDYDEIVEITGLPMGTVKSSLHRARKELADHLENLGGSAKTHATI